MIETEKQIPAIILHIIAERDALRTEVESLRQEAEAGLAAGDETAKIKNAYEEYLAKLRTALGARTGEMTHVAAERVVSERHPSQQGPKELVPAWVNEQKAVLVDVVKDRDEARNALHKIAQALAFPVADPSPETVFLSVKMLVARFEEFGVVLGKKPGEDFTVAARRVVAERDARAPFGINGALEIRELTKATGSEDIVEAVKRVVAERDALHAGEGIATVSHAYVEQLRDALGVPDGDSLLAAVGRVVAERDEARKNVRAPVPPGWGPEDILNIGKILNRAYDEMPLQAAERVAKERDALRADVERLNGEKIGTYLTKLRTLLGAPKDEDTHVAVERVVAERDEAQRQRESQRRIQARDVVSIRSLAKAHTLEDTFAAVRRVVTERDEALRQCEVLKACSDEIISIREYLGSTDQEPNTLGQVNNIVKSKDRAVTERDEAQKRAETFRMQLESHERMSANLRSTLGHPQVALEEAARLVVKELQETRSVLGAKNDEAADAVALRMLKLGLDFKSERDAARANLSQEHASRSLLQEQFAAMRTERDATLRECKEAYRHNSELAASLEKAVAERDEAQKHNEHLLTSVAHEQNLASKVLKELEEANLARAELSASLEKAVAGRDELQQNLDAATKMLNDMSEAVQSVVKERDALLPASNDPNNPRLELEGFRKGDLVSTPNQKEYVPIERVGIGHGGFWYVYVNGGWEPQALVRKPIAKGDTARCVSGPFEGETVRVVGVDANYVEMVREGHLGTVHVIDWCQAVAVAS